MDGPGRAGPFPQPAPQPDIVRAAQKVRARALGAAAQKRGARVGSWRRAHAQPARTHSGKTADGRPPPARPPRATRPAPPSQDDVYLQGFTDAAHDVARQLLGPLGALRHARATRTAAAAAYFGLTTGAGLQTLGEEYVDILQTTGAGALPPPALRAALVALQAAGPVAADWAAARLAAAAAPSSALCDDEGELEGAND